MSHSISSSDWRENMTSGTVTLTCICGWTRTVENRGRAVSAAVSGHQRKAAREISQPYRQLHR